MKKYNVQRLVNNHQSLPFNSYKKIYSINEKSSIIYKILYIKKIKLRKNIKIDLFQNIENLIA